MTKDKPVYVTCQVGLRGYVAARILTQNGFNAYNLAGGYRLYNSIFGIAPVSRVRMNPETQLPEGEQGNAAPKDYAHRQNHRPLTPAACSAPARS